MDEWLFSVAVKKGVYALAKGIVAFTFSAKLMVYEKQFGIQIDPQTFQTAVGSVLFAIEHMIHDWLKMQFPNVRWL
jgi:hypothetical protein